jgi:hypothetical protein
MVGETLLLDIGDETGRCIEITPTGWRVLPTAPVKFQRMPGMTALPLPERGGDINQLRPFTNLSDANFILYIAVLTDALCPGRPHAVLNLVGESGSGKTTAARIARSLTGSRGTGRPAASARRCSTCVRSSGKSSRSNSTGHRRGRRGRRGRKAIARWRE